MVPRVKSWPYFADRKGHQKLLKVRSRIANGFKSWLAGDLPMPGQYCSDEAAPSPEARARNKVGATIAKIRLK